LGKETRLESPLSELLTKSVIVGRSRQPSVERSIARNSGGMPLWQITHSRSVVLEHLPIQYAEYKKLELAWTCDDHIARHVLRYSGRREGTEKQNDQRTAG